MTNHNDFGAAFDGAAIVAAGGRAAPGSGLQEENFADAAVAADAVADFGEHTCHLGVVGVQDAFAREQYLEENRRKQRCAEDSAHNRQQKNQWSNEDTVAMQQVAGSAKPAKERGEGEAIDSGEAPGTAAMRAAAIRACAVVGQRRVTDLTVSWMQMRMNMRESAEYSAHP